MAYQILPRPNSFEEFLALTKGASQLKLVCDNCGPPFTNANVFSAEGWAETQISGYCEDCFDDLFVGDGT